MLLFTPKSLHWRAKRDNYGGRVYREITRLAPAWLTITQCFATDLLTKETSSRKCAINIVWLPWVQSSWNYCSWNHVVFHALLGEITCQGKSMRKFASNPTCGVSTNSPNKCIMNGFGRIISFNSNGINFDRHRCAQSSKSPVVNTSNRYNRASPCEYMWCVTAVSINSRHARRVQLIDCYCG